VRIWNPLLSKYTPGFVQSCKWAEENAKELAERFLRTNMFSDLSGREQDIIVTNIVDKLTNLSNNKSHDRHISIDECLDMKLKIVNLDSDKPLRDAVLSIHHCYMYHLANTPIFKIVENQAGRRFMKVQNQPAVQFMIPAPLAPAPGRPT
jgi:hypothetical protein